MPPSLSIWMVHMMLLMFHMLLHYMIVLWDFPCHFLFRCKAEWTYGNCWS